MPLLPALADQLRLLEAAGLIQLSAATPELAYTFRHALTRDAAYSSLLRGQRRAVHRAAGQALEASCGTPALRASAALLLAEHWTEAGDPARALDFWELAADQALAQYALPEAIAHLGRAIELAPEIPGLPTSRWAALYLQRGRAQYSNTDWQAAWDTHTALLALAERLGDDAVRLAALLELANQRATMNPLLDLPQARSLSEQALDLARHLGDRAAEAKALWVLMRAYSLTEGERTLASAAGEQSLALARAHGLEEQAAYTLSDLQYAYRGTGQDERALAVLAEARVYWRAHQQQHMLADNLNQSAMLALVVGDYALAEATAAEALALSLPTHNLTQTIMGRTTLAQVYLDQGQYGRAHAMLAELDPNELRFFTVVIQNVQAIITANMGQVADAIASLHAALRRNAAASELMLFRYGQLSCQAYLCAHAGQLPAAEACVREARALPLMHEVFRFQNYGYYLPLAEAALARARHDWPAARSHYTALIGRLAATGPRPVAAEAQWRYGQALAAQAAPEAEMVLTQAVETAEGFGQRRVAWRAWHALAEWQAGQAQAETAAASLARARDHLGFIVDGLTDPALRADFINLPDVRAVLHSAA